MPSAGRPILIVPGMPGSVLVRTDTNPPREIWPNVTLSGARPDIAALLDPAIPVEAVDLVRQVTPLLYVYQVLLNLFRSVPFGNRNYGDPNFRLFIFPFDWRRDLRETARALATALRTLRDAHDDLAPDLICHSTGGLVARYALQSGDFFPGEALAHRIVFAGTPHRGLFKTLLAVDGQLDEYPGVSAAQVQQLCRHPGFHGPRQLFPPPGEGMVWQEGTPGAPLGPADIYDGGTWQAKLGLDPAVRQHVVDFWAGANRRTLRAAGVELALCLAGGAYPTVTHLTLLRAAHAGYWLDPMEQLDAGDGTVPSSSAYLDGCPSLNSAEEHFLLFRDPDAKAAILQFLDPSLPASPIAWEPVPSPGSGPG